MFNFKNVARTVVATACVAIMSLSAACGSASSSSSDTVTDGKLTIATGQPAYTPWVIGNKPSSGKGYEAAVAYAVAKQMGYSKSDVVWTRTTFDAAIAPGTKDWDMNIQQFSITAKRKKAVDFSPSYYNATQSIVVLNSSSYANASSLSELKGAAIGAMVGTTSYTYAVNKIQSDIQTFNDNDALVQALAAGQLDALVVDTPTAVNMVESGQADNGKVLGQISGSEDPEGLGIVLPKNSALTAKVTKAVNALKKNGTLEKLQKKWLSAYTTDIPVLK